MLIKLWNRPQTAFIYGTPLVILIGYTARFLPFAYLTLASTLKQIPHNLEEATALATPSWWLRIKTIVLPLSAPGLIAAWAIVFVLCLGELGTTLLIIPPGEATLPIRIYTLMHYGAGHLVAALCLLLVFISTLALLLLKPLPKRFQR